MCLCQRSLTVDLGMARRARFTADHLRTSVMAAHRGRDVGLRGDDPGLRILTCPVDPCVSSPVAFSRHRWSVIDEKKNSQLVEI